MWTCIYYQGWVGFSHLDYNAKQVACIACDLQQVYHHDDKEPAATYSHSYEGACL